MNRQQLRAVYEKTDNRCWYCGHRLHPLGDWQVEHQHPRAKGGNDDTSNLVPACRDCNSLKGNRTVEEYRQALNTKMENAISAAREMVWEIQDRVNWDRSSTPDEYGFTTNPPAWLQQVERLMVQASHQTVNASIQFYGEEIRGEISAAPIEELEAVQ